MTDGLQLMDPVEYDVFISYSRADNTGGWVSGLRDAIYQDFREFSSKPFRIFFDTNEIHSRQDWELRPHVGAGLLSESSLYAELGEIVAGKRPGRERDDERILFWHRGLATTDIAYADLIHRLAVGRGLGTSLRYR
jgi:ornithine cyclodeaminase/alanine dehydrogenase-like protein (mu-crystallin family)